MLARVGRPPHMHPLHLTRSSPQSLFKPSETMSFLTHSPHVFLLLPFRLAPSTSKRPYNSTLDILFFRVTPHIHLTIIFSVLSNLCISSTLIGHVSLPYTKTL